MDVSQPPTPQPTPPKRNWGLIWAAVGALAGVVGVVIAVIQLGSNSPKAPDPVETAADGGRYLCEKTPRNITRVAACGSGPVGGPHSVALKCDEASTRLPANDMTYPIAGPQSPQWFRATIVNAPFAIDDPGAIRFTVLTNGQPIFDEVLAAGQGARKLDLSLSKVNTLTIRVTCDTKSDWGIFEDVRIG